MPISESPLVGVEVGNGAADVRRENCPDVVNTDRHVIRPVHGNEDVEPADYVAADETEKRLGGVVRDDSGMVDAARVHLQRVILDVTREPAPPLNLELRSVRVRAVRHKGVIAIDT